MYVVLMSLAAAILLVEVVLLALSVRGLRRWWNHAARRPRTGLGLVRGLVLPVLPDLVVAGFYLLFLPSFSGSPLNIAVLYQPDLGVLIAAGLALAIGWAPLRTVLGVVALRRSPRPADQTQPGTKGLAVSHT